MDLIKVVMKDMLAGEKVRIGYLGLTPIFSLSQAINLAAGYSSSSSFGSTFINCTMKDKHPALYALIVHYRFPPSPHKAPCMTFPNILKTMSAVKCTFSTCLNEIASTGLLQAEAGDRTLLEYVLKNAASDSPYHNLVRQIIYADSNPENFEIQGTEEALGGTAIAQDEQASPQATAPPQEYYANDEEVPLEQHVLAPAVSANPIYRTIQIPNNHQCSRTIQVQNPVNYQRSVAIQIPINAPSSSMLQQESLPLYPRQHRIESKSSERMAQILTDSMIKMSQQSSMRLEATFERMASMMQQQSAMSEERILRMSKEREEMAVKAAKEEMTLKIAKERAEMAGSREDVTASDERVKLILAAAKENEEKGIQAVKAEAERKEAELQRKLLEEKYKADRIAWEQERRAERLLEEKDELAAKYARLIQEQPRASTVIPTQTALSPVQPAVSSQASTSATSGRSAAQATASQPVPPTSSTANYTTQRKPTPRKWFCMVYGGPMFDPEGFNQYITTTERYSLSGSFQVLKMQNAVDEGRYYCLLTLDSDKGETYVSHVINNWIGYNSARGRGRMIVYELFNKRKGDMNKVIEIIEAARALDTLYEWPSPAAAAATAAARREAIGDGDDDD